MSAPLRAKKKNNTVALILVGLLVISLTGFGVRSVGTGGSQAVGAVGDEEVSVNTYVRALNNRLRAFSQQIGQNITMEQARVFGIDRQVLAQVLTAAALDGESARIGLSVGDERVKESLLATQAFQGLSGQFDQAAYEFALEQAGLSPSEYDEILRGDSTRQLLQVSIAGGIRVSETYGLALLNYVGETRNFSWAIIGQDLLAEPTRDPTDAEIEALYKADPESYTAPEKRRITLALLTPDMLIPSIETDDAALQELYDSQPDRFNTPARRIVDRVVFGNDAEAQAALSAMASGDKSFADIVSERGLALEDVDLGEVSRSDLRGAAAEAVFTATEPGLVGPVTTTLGPAIFRVNAVLEAQNQPFEEVREVLHLELVADQARRQIDDGIGDIDDLLAGGVELEEIVDETDMVLQTLDFIEGSEEGLAAYDEFRQAATNVRKEDFPEVVMMSDGGIFALRLDEVIPPALIDLADIRDQVIADWKRGETRNRLMQMAEATKSSLSGGDSFEAHALTSTQETAIRRESFIENAPQDMVAAVFALEDNEIAIVEGNGIIALVRLTAITPFDEKQAQSATALANLSQQYSAQVGSDIFEAFTGALQEEAGITVNQALIEAVFSQLGRSGQPAPRHQPMN